MNEARIKNLIKSWVVKAQEESSDQFAKFFFLWIGFNAWLERISDMDHDADMIRWLVGQHGQGSDLVRVYEHLRNGTIFLPHLKILADNSPYEDVRGIKPSITITGPDDFENIIWAIYRIRCNLFHGGKSPGDPRDLRVVTMAVAILERWMGSLVAEWRRTG